MTDEDLAIMKRDLDAITWQSCLRAGRLRRRAERDARAQTERVRAPDYRRALAAAESWVRSRKDDPCRRRVTLHADAPTWQRVVVDLAAEAGVRIEWLAPGARSTQLVGSGNAQAHSRAQTIVCPPVIDLASATTCLHEIGHCRDLHTQGAIYREINAWEWARRHAPVWNDVTQALMVSSMNSYLAVADRGDVIGVIAAERLMSGVEYRHELARRWRAQLERVREKH